MKYLAFALFFVLSSGGIAATPLFPNADFENGSLENWTADGEAFSWQPTKGDNPAARKREPSKHQGSYWIGTYEKYNGTGGRAGQTQGDNLQGSLTSPEFTITKPFITYLIGGGHRPGETGVRLVCDGQEIELSSGFDSETMIKTSSDVSRFVGKRARLVVFDNARGGWGHINVDDFTATDEAVPEPSKEFSFSEGISASGYPDTGYDQPLRPQFHFSSRRNWLNDPNGMVHDGQHYHLFFQHNPKGTEWGNMTWGHATSIDMVHWRQHDHALLPYRVEGRSGTIFSGTAVVDHNNSLGKQVGETKTLCAFFTFAAKPKFYQAMAYSTDNGKTWTYWNEGRAVVPNQGFDNGERDPKVFWHEPTKQWVMVLWVQRKPGRVRFFSSPNLTDWTFSSDLMRDWAFECMDLVFLPVDGNADHTKCLIYDASFDYEIGTFDGKQFKGESGRLQAGGGNFYAAQTFNQSPDGRVVQIGWMRGGPNSAKKYGLPSNQQMSFPCELTLKSTPQGVRLYCWPVNEIETLVRASHNFSNVALDEGNGLLEGLETLDLVDLSIDFHPGTAKQIILDVPRLRLIYDAETQELSFPTNDKEGKPQQVTVLSELSPQKGSIRLRLLIDRLSVEVFAFEGEKYKAHYYDPELGSGKQSLQVLGGTAKVNTLSIHRLESAWK